DQKVLKADKPVLVDLWATWCKPCLMVAPIIDELAEEFSGRISFVKVDVDQNPKTASRYGIMSIPTLLIFKNGEPVSHIVGVRPKAELKRNLNAVLE
ncbi:MAG: thioredoxin, partial [Chloroflexi bacterium]|nr:thioredoxin [Chloroflexota bacterium]